MNDIPKNYNTIIIENEITIIENRWPIPINKTIVFIPMYIKKVFLYKYFYSDKIKIKIPYGCEIIYHSYK